MRGYQDSMGMILAKMPNSEEMELEETTSRTWPSSEARDHLPMFKIFNPEMFLSIGNAGTKMEGRLEGRLVTGPTWDPSHISIQNPDTITEAILCVQTQAWQGCPWKRSTNNWLKQSQIFIANH
jgi:hypothetical protein